MIFEWGSTYVYTYRPVYTYSMIQLMGNTVCMYHTVLTVFVDTAASPKYLTILTSVLFCSGPQKRNERERENSQDLRIFLLLTFQRMSQQYLALYATYGTVHIIVHTLYSIILYIFTWSATHVYAYGISRKCPVVCMYAYCTLYYSITRNVSSSPL